MDKNSDFDSFVRRFAENMGIPYSEVLSNSRLIRILKEMFSETVKQNGKEDV